MGFWRGTISEEFKVTVTGKKSRNLMYPSHVKLIKPLWPSAPGVAVNSLPLGQFPAHSILNRF